MKTNDLLLRCYGEHKDNQWSVVCIDLCLAAQADTLNEAKEKLNSMMVEYIDDCLNGEDQEYAYDLLNRKAPLEQFAKYYWFKVLISFGRIKNDLAEIFINPIHFKPCH